MVCIKLLWALTETILNNNSVNNSIRLIFDCLNNSHSQTYHTHSAIRWIANHFHISEKRHLILLSPSAPIAYATSGSSSAKPNYLISRLNGWSSLSFGIRFACWLPSCPNGSCMQLSIGNQLRISCMRPSVCSPPYLYLYSCFCWN